ncbi:hypothetical protein PDJAM_G00199210 [Pangasius djambal]|uniref:Uncharacterized protein n=1 Tax=Pangasius djambal TaxID=1691987 RepID=A0ACC5Y760_9TELE|nr:hypothetical protein [Pangasius djambal]
MSKLVLMIFTLVILATILSNHSVQSQNRLKQLIQKSGNLCTCTFHRHNLVTLKTQDSSKADGLYLCTQRNGKVEPSKRKSSGNDFYIQSQNRLKQLIQKSGNLCTCTFHRHNLVTLKTQDSSKADGLYLCTQRNGKVEPSKRKSSGNDFYSISIPF